MTLSATALITLVQAKAHLRIDAAAELHVSAEFVGVGDGADLTFDLDHTPIEGSLRLYVNNVLQVETTNYSISVATITFVVAPPLNQGITANYDYTAVDDTFESYDDLLLEGMIEAATKKAEEYTGMAFIQRAITERHLGNGTEILKLWRRPIASITSVVRHYSEDIGTGDGTTVVFTLAEIPTASSYTIYKDAVAQTDVTDYAISGSTLTFVVAPADGAEITAIYTHTIKAISEYTNLSGIGRLKGLYVWAEGMEYTVVYTAGQAATRAATQALVPDAVAAVLLMVSYLYENRTDRVGTEATTGIGSITYESPQLIERSAANRYLDALAIGSKGLG